MWNILISLLSQSDPAIHVDSRAQPLHLDKPFYAWTDRLSLDGFDCDLILSVQLTLGSERIEIQHFTIHKGLLRYGVYGGRIVHRRRNSIYGREDHDMQNIFHHDSGCMMMNYCASIYGERAVIHIYAVSVTLSNDVFRDLLQEHRGHKITCMLNDVYLDRPHHIGPNGRNYCWQRGEWDSISLDAAAEDLLLIRVASPRGPRAEGAQRVVHNAALAGQWDGPNYANAAGSPQLPMRLERGHALNVQFFELKYIPPRTICYRIAWGLFVAAALVAAHTPQRPRLQRRAIARDPVVHEAVIAGVVDLGPRGKVHFVRNAREGWIDVTRIEGHFFISSQSAAW